MENIIDIVPLTEWGLGFEFPLLIAGPCSAESEEQVLATAKELAADGRVKIFRAGVWKPRTRPGGFEGLGEQALKWLKRVKSETGLSVAVEVAMPQHVELALEYAIDVVWLGARTTANPFLVEQLAAALSGANIPVLVKNPVTPDLELWIGSIERLWRSGIKRIAAIHRGFHPYERSRLRNIPKWEIAIDLKSRIPSLPVICDPSHIAGKANLVPEIAQHALDLSMDGLMVEVHPTPLQALSDAMQQLTPRAFINMIDNLNFHFTTSTDYRFIDFLEQVRNRIDSIDQQIIELLAARMKLVEQIGEYKRTNNVSIFQLRRWENILKSRIECGKRLGLDEEYIKNLLQLVHKESIKKQAEILRGNQPNKKE
ncbi:3-deoxy-7-phosphoheptulonate synthase [Tenuifilum thalassicum]|uniref:chorismate mutase n=1 Tax=Tenuifilum thalassicum TaxID=2590900 RepID=A0A7D3XFL0_9BACT|nr:3-deoxy-7-phosphoheptulonate synthase [Tenuifilum thalassicum]